MMEHSGATTEGNSLQEDRGKKVKQNSNTETSGSAFLMESDGVIMQCDVFLSSTVIIIIIINKKLLNSVTYSSNLQ